MGRAFRLTAIALIAVVIILQFIQPQRNDAVMDPDLDMLELLAPAEPIADLIRNACYDCHSNQTDYPWYDRISPVSWYLNGHIREGKEELNFSEYGLLDKTDKIGLFADFCDVLDAGSMPLPSYQRLHKEARLSQEEREQLCNWSEQAALKVMRD